MLHPETMGRAAEQGYANGFAFYFAGRGGVLGDVDADVVAAAMGWFNPAVVRAMWDEGVAIGGARATARRYNEACAAWGRDHLAGIRGLDRFVALGEKIAAGADGSGLPLFAGWRAESRVDDAPGRAMQLIHVLREWRGAIHLVGDDRRRPVADGGDPHQRGRRPGRDVRLVGLPRRDEHQGSP